MNQTLVGYFDNDSDATRARQELLQAGFADNSVTVQANTATGTTGTGATATTATAGYDDDRNSGIGGFFRSLFGLDDDDRDVDVYAEGVRRGGAIVVVHVDSDEQMSRAEDILERCGAADVDERAAKWRNEGWTGGATGTAALAGDAAVGRTDVASGDARTIPVVEEELRVGKREVRRGGLRVFTRVVETPVEETVRLREEHADVQRRTVDRPATEADFAAMKEGTIEVRETSEEAVVSKVARVTEEVEVGKTVTERDQTVRDTVRHTDVQVEQLSGDATPTGTVRTGAMDTTGRPGATGTTGAAYGTGTTGTTGAAYGAGAAGVTNESQAKGLSKQAEGEAKDRAGDASGDLSQQLAGKLEKAAGKVQEGYGNMKQDVKKS